MNVAELKDAVLQMFRVCSKYGILRQFKAVFEIEIALDVLTMWKVFRVAPSPLDGSLNFRKTLKMRKTLLFLYTVIKNYTC